MMTFPIQPEFDQTDVSPRYAGWRRVLSLDEGAMTFHIPDTFDVGNLRQIDRNWDGHSTREKWIRVLQRRDILFNDLEDI